MLTQTALFIQKKWKKEKIIANILDFPHILQPNEYSCGAACVQSILWYYGDREKNEYELESMLQADPREWIVSKNILKFFKKKKFKLDAREMTLNDVETYINTWIPVMVLLQARSRKKVNYTTWWDNGHFSVVIWYSKEYLLFSDPLSTTPCYLLKKEFLARWHDVDGKTKVHNYGIAVYGKKLNYDSLSLKKIW